MRVLMVHNEYGRASGEEHAVQAIADLLRAHGHEVFWFRRSSAEILGSVAGKVKAFFTGIHNPVAARDAYARSPCEIIWARQSGFSTWK